MYVYVCKAVSFLQASIFHSLYGCHTILHNMDSAQCKVGCVFSIKIFTRNTALITVAGKTNMA